MIFSPISTSTSVEDKVFQKELISVYCMIVREMCNKNCITDTLADMDSPSPEVFEELKRIGVANTLGDLVPLKGLLQSQLYKRFLKSVFIAITYPHLFEGVLDKLSNAKRKRFQDLEKKSNKPTIADFFAGAGGLSLGFIQSGYKVSFANDFEEVCINTYKYNHPEIPAQKVLRADIRNIVNDISEYVSEDVDLVIGGPPCQGFSSANQQRIIDDPRNELYKYFLIAVERLAPKFVVMENVKGMLSVAHQVVEDYRAIHAKKNGQQYHYDIHYELLNSADFSVAQSRERLIYIAIRDDVAQRQGITPQDVFKKIKESCVGLKHYNLEDALAFIKPLNAPRVKNTNEIDDELTGKKIDTNRYTGHDNEYLSLINQGRDIPLLFNHKARYVNDINYDIYRLLNPGDDASDPKIADIMPYKHRLHCFKDKYYKLIPNKPSRTITAHLRMDCHSHIHPYQVRAITPREAARCQSFPDDYLFLGPYLKTYMEIGNAVPCLMARKIAETIKAYLI